MQLEVTSWRFEMTFSDFHCHNREAAMGMRIQRGDVREVHREDIVASVAADLFPGSAAISNGS